MISQQRKNIIEQKDIIDDDCDEQKILYVFMLWKQLTWESSLFPYEKIRVNILVAYLMCILIPVPMYGVHSVTHINHLNY